MKKARTKKHLAKKHHKKSSSGGLAADLEMYAFWTGFVSTLISLAGVLVQVFR